MNNILSFDPPLDEKELLYRANLISGISLGELSTYMGVIIPKNLKKNKGWIGLLIENFLGGNAKNKSIPDFYSLGIELKTIPIDNLGKPIETTFICLVSFLNNNEITWENSNLRKKLMRVLWVPIQGEKSIPLYKRIIGTPLIWSPSIKEEYKLKKDWEELMDLINLGKIEFLTSHNGEFLQLRTKSTNNKVLTSAIDEFGKVIFTKPRGFYLTKKFTYKILKKNFFYKLPNVIY